MIHLLLSSLRSHAKQMVSAVVVMSLSLFLIMQQMSTVQKVISSSFGIGLQGIDVWVMAPEEAISKMKNVEGVVAAAPLIKGTSYIRGKKWTVIGVDESSYLGLPRNIAAGNIQHLSLEGAVLVDSKHSRLKIGNVLPIGKSKAVVVGLYHSSKEPIIYTTLDRAHEMAQLENAGLPFILVKAKEGVDLPTLCQRIKKVTGHDAFSRRDFLKMATQSYLKTAGMPSRFAWTIFLGFFLALGIMCATLISVCDKLKRNLALFQMLGASKSIVRMVGLAHCVAVCLLSFLCSFLCSIFFTFSWKVVGCTLMTILLMGSVIPLLFVRSHDRLPSAV